MNKNFLIMIIVIFAAEIAALIWIGTRKAEKPQSIVTVNEIINSVERDWNDLENHVNETDLDYVVIDGENLLFSTRDGLSESVNAAVIHRDTILDLKNGAKIIVYNNSDINSQKNKITVFLAAATALQAFICAAYASYLNSRIIKPFAKMKGFAERVAGGNLDIPLEMDRGNLFGAFTESFDIMRSELKKARIAEARANASKKELVAKLSHDIRTPVASIKAVSELGTALAEREKTRENYKQIIQKADQISTLVNNLFSATLEELQQLTVSPSDMQSMELGSMLENADYFHKAQIPDIPECLIYADKLRLQQVFDNIFTNSYKYANTDIEVNVALDNGKLDVEIEDYGGGVSAEELPLLNEKFKRGNNTKGIDGAGLGLYISDRFMTQMKGKLKIENGEHGLKVTILILLSGNI